MTAYRGVAKSGVRHRKSLKLMRDCSKEKRTGNVQTANHIRRQDTGYLKGSVDLKASRAPEYFKANDTLTPPISCVNTLHPPFLSLPIYLFF